MNFDLFSFDFIHKDRLYGFWVARIKHYSKHWSGPKNLFGLYYSDGELTLSILYFNISKWVWLPND